MPRRRLAAFATCAVLTASMLATSSPSVAVAEDRCGAELNLEGRPNSFMHRTSFIVGFVGTCGPWTTAPSYSWQHNGVCGNWLVATGDQGEQLSRVDWDHGPEHGCEPHEFTDFVDGEHHLNDHDIIVTVTVTTPDFVSVCTVQDLDAAFDAQNNGETFCAPAEQGGEARIESSSYPLTARIAKAQRQFKRVIDPLVAEYNQVAEAVEMQQRAVENEAELHDFRIANVRTIEAQISELRQDIADGIGSEDSAEMERLQRWLKNAQLEELAVRLRLHNKERRLEESIVRRDGLALQLWRFAQPLQAVDFELTGLSVNAGARKVYEVELASPYSRLHQLTREIRTQTANVNSLLEQKKEYFTEFQAAHQSASRQLIVIADLIWWNAKKKAAIDFASHGLDVLAAASKGGWAGVITEVTAKVYETFFKDVVFADPVGNPNPGQEAIDAWMRESAVETVGENALSIGVQRGVKETAVKVAKDWLKNGLKEEFPGIFGGTAPTGTPPSMPDGAVDKSTRMRDRLAKLARDKMRTETFRRGFRDWFESGVGRKLLQDSVKAWFNTDFKNDEMAAWADYMQRDMHAQGWYSIWKAANNAYWEAEDALVAMELEKERILDAFDPTQLIPVVKVQESFETPATLRIRLLVPRSMGPFDEIPVKVLVNGVEARRTSSTVFEISTERLSGTQLAVEVL